MSGEVKLHYASFRRRFADGQNLVGSFIKTPTTHATEIFGALGYDFVMIDEEHAPFDRAVTDMVVLAARASNLASIVRVSSDDPTKILHRIAHSSTTPRDLRISSSPCERFWRGRAA